MVHGFPSLVGPGQIQTTGKQQLDPCSVLQNEIALEPTAAIGYNTEAVSL